MSNLIIVPSLFDSKEFYIFRDSGDEVKCTINKKNRLRSYKYKLTEHEIETIVAYYSVDLITKKPL